MSDTVLARKWRPKNFSELVGQEHVMQALANALDQQRLHHAYLFTGTRGVGKTTIARIFSKALNCEQGISSKPCGVCSTCRSIDEGRFVDLIEVDAASKTKVEDTRELLENVQYAPVQGRYKVYLIDEVHMLSKSSFNALLKTLEEPPEHVKFLLATTDPHKLPMTVLSRCLQFNLMRLTQTQIQTHLGYILQQEGISFEDAALAMIAKSADGSARDSLSILDQAIAYGGGQVQLAAVQAMLGLVDQQFTRQILAALADESAEELKNVIQQLAAMGVDYMALNAQLIEVLHQISLLQVLNTLDDACILDDETMRLLADALAPERVQVLYQIALLAKQDMSMAPDIRIGFEMALLRMLAFQPGTQGEGHLESGEASSGNAVGDGGSMMAKITRPGDVLKQQGLTAPTGVSEPVQTVPEPTLPEISPAAQPAASHAPEVSAPQAEPAQPPSQNFEQEAVQQETPPPSSPSIAADKPDVPDAPVDHLADLKARLDLTLGKPDSLPQSSAESVAPSAPPSLETPTSAQEEPIQESPSMPGFGPDTAAESSSTVNAIKAEAPLPWEEEDSQMVSQQMPSTEPTTETAPADLSVSVAPAEAAVEALSDKANLASDARFEVEASESNAVHSRIDHGAEAQEPGLSSEAAGIRIAVEGDWGDAEKWLQLIVQLQLDGMAAELARQSILVSQDAQTLTLSVDPQQRHAKTELALQRLEEQLKSQLGCRLVFVESDQTHLTPARYENEMKAQRQANAVNSIQSDPQVQNLIQTLNLKVIESSIRPVKQ
ncbi:hypothetical protein AVO42_04625 [Thiomicrospira sp. XS5]|uniref:DNA polymerase III subunit gamma/tau n=1 Tax=Thiomicrospira sp. XS5 TaxID=1775636 RepID=UPI000748B7C5|nr:DNA polymerase III subunit gamma/tau [Thiomicrospira sp. XS5]KUJ74681.1 hypothetical protein AVO42_04625 [Thiomicrospira sp. XS5]